MKARTKKIKPITPREFLDQWSETVQTSLLPERIVKEKRPDKILEDWGADLPNHRERLRQDTDALIEKLLAVRRDEDVVDILFAAPPELVAVFYHRLQTAGKQLRVDVHLSDFFLKPGGTTWRDLVKTYLLLRGTFQ
jgi:hypothetical protein